MATGVRLFHSRINLDNYVLVKPTETKAFLYKLNKDCSINKMLSLYWKKLMINCEPRIR